jgi:hypothetical protein
LQDSIHDSIGEALWCSLLFEGLSEASEFIHLGLAVSAALEVKVGVCIELSKNVTINDFVGPWAVHKGAPFHFL